MYPRHLNPFPSNLGEIVRAYDRVLIPEMNLGQLRKLIRADFLVDAQGLNKVMGLPFRVIDIERAILAVATKRCVTVGFHVSGYPNFLKHLADDVLH